MKYREIIKKVQLYSGFSDQESKDALDGAVATIAVHLTEGGRKNFASQLPDELQSLALAVYPTDDMAGRKDLLNQFAEIQGVEIGRAKKQLLSAWKALKDAISSGEIEHVKAQMPIKVRLELLR